MKCRICGTDTLEKYLDLGQHPPSDNFLNEADFANEKRYPLKVMFCRECCLSQLSCVVPKEELYNTDYVYETRLNKEGVKHFHDLAYILNRYFERDDLVVDIGSNDGTLLQGFHKRGAKVCGIEPVEKIAMRAEVPTITGFFDKNTVEMVLRAYGRASIITATNVFAHIDNLHEFTINLGTLLKPDGVFIIEAPYFIDLIDNLEFDTIYHEHLSYLSLTPLIKLFGMHGMEVFNIDWIPVHGGSLRYYIARKGQYPVSTLIGQVLSCETGYYIDRLDDFASDVERFKIALLSYLARLKHNGKTIVGVSAPAKGNTLLNYCGIGTETLDYITDRSSKKIGKFTPGTHIPVVDDTRLLQGNPDYAMILAWNWEKQIKRALKDYRGEWIIPNAKGIENIYNGAYGAGWVGGTQKIAV